MSDFDDLLDLAVEYSETEPSASDRLACAQWAWLRYQVLRADQARIARAAHDVRQEHRAETAYTVAMLWGALPNSDQTLIGEHEPLLANALDALRAACEPAPKETPS